jgi:hypothetical protein
MPAALHSAKGDRCFCEVIDGEWSCWLQAMTVFFCKSTIMPMFTFSEDLGPLPHWEVSMPSHASVSVVSAACAVGTPASITARATTRGQTRSIAEPQPAQP